MLFKQNKNMSPRPEKSLPIRSKTGAGSMNLQVPTTKTATTKFKSSTEEPANSTEAETEVRLL